jgi:hypothetical protein
LLEVQIACNSILERLRGLKLDELLRREVRETLLQFGNVRIPGVLALEKLVLSAEEREPLERQMLELLQQVVIQLVTFFISIFIVLSGRCNRFQRHSIGANE